MGPARWWLLAAFVVTFVSAQDLGSSATVCLTSVVIHPSMTCDFIAKLCKISLEDLFERNPYFQNGAVCKDPLKADQQVCCSYQVVRPDPEVPMPYLRVPKPYKAAPRPYYDTPSYEPYKRAQQSQEVDSFEVGARLVKDSGDTRPRVGTPRRICPQICPAVFAPVCGAYRLWRITFSNSCWLNAAACWDWRVRYLHRGACRFGLANDPDGDDDEEEGSGDSGGDMKNGGRKDQLFFPNSGIEAALCQNPTFRTLNHWLCRNFGDNTEDESGDNQSLPDLTRGIKDLLCKQAAIRNANRDFCRDFDDENGDDGSKDQFPDLTSGIKALLCQQEFFRTTNRDFCRNFNGSTDDGSKGQSFPDLTSGIKALLCQQEFFRTTNRDFCRNFNGSANGTRETQFFNQGLSSSLESVLCSNADFKTKNRRFCSDLSLGVLDLNILDLATLVLGNDEDDGSSNQFPPDLTRGIKQLLCPIATFRNANPDFCRDFDGSNREDQFFSLTPSRVLEASLCQKESFRNSNRRFCRDYADAVNGARDTQFLIPGLSGGFEAGLCSNTEFRNKNSGFCDDLDLGILDERCLRPSFRKRNPILCLWIRNNQANKPEHGGSDLEMDDGQDEHLQDVEQDSKCDMKCPHDIIAPVCGSDGKTYINQCLCLQQACMKPELQLTVASLTECPSDYANRTSQDNSRFHRGRFWRHRGWGPFSYLSPFWLNPFFYSACPAICPLSFIPVCGTDGNTYYNECYLRRTACANPFMGLGVRHGGQCLFVVTATNTTIRGSQSYHLVKDPIRQPSACKDISECRPELAGYKSVCGSDGVTYPNLCQLEVVSCKNPAKHLYMLTDAPCRSDIWTSCQESCTKEAKPVCGSDGTTYINECFLRLAACRHYEKSIVKVSEGSCPDDPQIDREPHKLDFLVGVGLGAVVGSRVNDGCFTIFGEKCKFPFRYRGIRYNRCTTDDFPFPWCATRTDSDADGNGVLRWNKCALGPDC